MARAAQHLAGRSIFDLLAGIEHGNVVADVRREPKVVGDEQHRRLMLTPLFGKQSQHIELAHHVERRGRFVGHDQRRIGDEGHRDQHALALPARQLVRIAVQHVVGFWQMHRIELLQHVRATLFG